MSAESKITIRSNSQATATMLGKVLRADGAFALISGLILFLGAKLIAVLIELSQPLALSVLRVVLLNYASMLFFVVGRPIELAGARLAIILNVSWVVASYTGLLLGWFPVNAAGKWVIALIAEAITIFATLEFIALRRATKEVVD